MMPEDLKGQRQRKRLNLDIERLRWIGAELREAGSLAGEQFV